MPTAVPSIISPVSPEIADLLTQEGWGTHICHLYEGASDLLVTQTHFFAAGLRSGHACVWLVNAPLTVAAARTGLGELVDDLDARLSRGQIEIVDARDRYGGDGDYDPAQAAQFWTDKLGEARVRGYPGLRISGNVQEAPASAAWAAIMEYEQRVDTLIHGSPVRALCCYNVKCLAPERIADVVSHHQASVVSGQGAWHLVQNREYKQADIHRVRTESLLKTAADSIPQGLMVYDQSGRYQFINQAAADWGGCSLAEVRGRTDRELFPIEGMADYLAALSEVYRGGRPVRLDLQLGLPLSAPTRQAWLACSLTPMIAEDGRVQQVVAVIDDVSERKLAEDSLRESEEHFRTLADNISQLAWMCDEKGDIFWYNKRWYDYTGATLEEVRGWGWQSVHHPAHVQRVVESIRQAFATGEPWEDTFPLRGVDGEYRWFLSRAVPILDPQGKVQRWFGTNTDITEQLATQAALTESRRHLKLILDNAPISINYVDSEERFRFANKAYAERLGFRPAEMVGRSVREIVGEEAYAWIGPKMREALGGKALSYEMRAMYGGRLRDLAVSYRPDVAEDGTVRGVVVVLDEITNRKQAEDALRASEEFNRRLIESSHDSIKVLSLDGRLLSVSGGARELLELDDPQGLIGHPWIELWPTDKHSEVLAAMEAARQGGVGRFQGSRPTARGRHRWWDVVVSPIVDHQGKAERLLAIARDVTEARQMEEQRSALLEAERAARGEAERTTRLKDEFLATVSHELRSPLNAIVGWTRLLARGTVESHRALEVITRNASGLTRIVEDLLDMGRIISGKIRLTPELVDLVPLVGNVVEGMQVAAEAKGLHIDLSFDPALEPLYCDSARIQQVVWNLLSNAVKFTPSGGQVCVAVTRAATGVEIIVTDTGEGIAADFLPHMFDRFRQADGSITRSHGGLGLGLSIVKHLVELHGGTIRAESPGPGRGARFTVCLPVGRTAEPGERYGARSESPSRLVAASAQESPTALAGLRILVVDDDASHCEMVERVLLETGAQVRTANSAAAGLVLVHSFRPHMLVSDIGMPGEDGYTFVQRVRSTCEQGSRMRCVALTGLARPEDRQTALRAGYDEHIGKPWEPSSLVAVLTRLRPAPEA